MKTKDNLGFGMYGLCFLIVSALIFSAAIVPACSVEDDEVNIPQADTDSWERNIESPRYFMYDDFNMLLRPRDILNVEEEENNGLERTFIGVTSVRADSPVIYLDSDNELYITVYNIGGSIGEPIYTENITATIGNIDELRDEYYENPWVEKLEKAIESLEESVIQVKQHQREESIRSVRNAVEHLIAAEQVGNGIPTEDIIIELTENVKFKVGTVICEAGRNFGTDNPDVIEAARIYDAALEKFIEKEYDLALYNFIDAYEIVLNVYTCDVNIDMYSWMPEGTETEIDRMRIEGLEAEEHKLLTVNWHPTRRGMHHIRFNMTGEYEVYGSPVETVEAPPRIMSFGFTVTQEAEEKITWWDGHTVPTNEEEEYPSPGYNSTEIVMKKSPFGQGGNLVIENGGTLIFNDNVTFVIENPDYAGQFGINITAGGKFIVNSPLRSTTIMSSAENHLLTYFFHNYGTADFLGANVMYTYGDRNDLTEPGGIQNFEGSVCVLDNTNILEADTHSVYITGDVEAYISGEETVIGRLDGYNPDIAKGHGIWVTSSAQDNGVTRSTPRIEDVTVQYNRMDGICIEGSTPGPIHARSLYRHAPGDYDLQLTDDGNESTQPVIAAGNGNRYMVYLDEDAQHINFMMSSDKGITWTDPIVVPESDIEEGYIGNIDFAADGDNLAVAWEVWTQVYPWDPEEAPTLYVQYSSNGGDIWANEPYIISLSCFPSVDVEGDIIYVAYLYRPDPPFPITGSVMIKWTGDGWSETDEHDFEIEVGIPEIAVADDTIHVAIASEGYIYYIYSQDGGGNWTDSEEIVSYGGPFAPEMPYGYISMDATENNVYLVWCRFNFFTGNYNVYGMYAEYISEEWVWSDDILISTGSSGNSIYPDVAIDTDGNWHVVWMEEGNEFTRIRYSRLLDRDDKVIVPNMDLTPDTPHAILPSISIDSEGYACVVWSDERGDATEIYIKQANGVIYNSIVRYNKDGGTTLLGSEGVKISHNIVSDNDGKGGISLDESNNNTITSNIVSNSENNGISNIRSDGIFLSSSDYNMVEYNIVSYSGWGIYILDSTEGNIIKGNNVSESDIGIHVYESSYNNMITGNNVSDNRLGILLFIYAKSNTIHGNNVSYNEIGISISNSHYNNNITENIISHNEEVGIVFSGTHNNTIDNNTISYNGDGIIISRGIHWTTDNTISNNNITNNQNAGIILDGNTNGLDNNLINNGVMYDQFGIPMHNIIMENVLSYNHYGVYIDSAFDNIIYNNNFINNTNQAWDNDDNQWDTGDPAKEGKGGNYWSDYEGEDRGDGIGDIPYEIDGGAGAQDNYPWMEQDGWTFYSNE